MLNLLDTKVCMDAGCTDTLIFVKPTFRRLWFIYIYVFLYPSPDIHRQWLISASSTSNGFRWTRLISSSSDVIFTKLPWSDGSLSSARRDSIRLLFTLQTLYTSAFTHLKKEKGCWGVNNPMKPGCSL